MKKQSENRVNVYQMVTDRIIEQLQQGIIPWHKPWTGVGVTDGGAINYVSRKPYSLLNQMLLGKAGEWLTFKQVKDAGGRIKKGATAGYVVYYSQVVFKDSEIKVNEDGTKEQVEIERIKPVLRYYNVFHLDDCEGIESKIAKVEETAEVVTVQPVEKAEQVINGYVEREEHLTFTNNTPSNRAYYSPMHDAVVVPMISQYSEAAEYYSTTFHELVHSTLHPKRCNRKADNAIAAFGSEDYSREELVAETGSAMLCNFCGLDSEKAFKNSVAYIQSWLKALKNDNKMIVWAASRAEKAAQYIIGA